MPLTALSRLQGTATLAALRPAASRPRPAATRLPATQPIIRASAAVPQRLDTLDSQSWVLQKAATPKGPPPAEQSPCGKRLPPSAELSAAVAPLAAACGADAAATTRAVACLGPGMQQGVLNHGLEVAAFLSSQDVPQTLQAALLRRCLPLFAQPPAKRAAPLMHQLKALGLTAEEAARCFEAVPAAGAVTAHAGFAPAIAAAGGLLQSGASCGTPGRRLLADLLIAQPTAAVMLALAPGELQERAEGLVALGLSMQELVAAVHKDAALLTMNPADLAQQEAVIRQELGADRDVFAAMLLLEPTALVDGCVWDLQRRVRALVEELGQQEALNTILDTPTLLTVDYD